MKESMVTSDRDVTRLIAEEEAIFMYGNLLLTVLIAFLAAG